MLDLPCRLDHLYNRELQFVQFSPEDFKGAFI